MVELTAPQSDNVIPSQGTEKYYEAVRQMLPDVHDIYRYFEAPGLGHCAGGSSGQPTSLFDQLRVWVENGTAPEQIPVEITDKDGVKKGRILCLFPQKARYDDACGDVGRVEVGRVECWSCQGHSTTVNLELL